MHITKTIALVVATVIGCSQSPPPSATQQPQAGTPAPESHEMHAPPGPAILLFAAMHHLDDLGLSAEQRATIENTARSLTPAVPLDHRLFAEVANGVRAGKIDEARVLAMVDAPASSTGSLSPTDALATLHATLKPVQRRALVDLIAKHVDDREAAMTAGAPGPERMIERVLSKLSLTADQRAAIDKIVAAQPAGDDVSAMHAFHDGLRDRLETFASEQFDAAAFVAATPAGSTGMRDHVQRTLRKLAAILPVLDATQREALASMIEAGPQHH